MIIKSHNNRFKVGEKVLYLFLFKITIELIYIYSISKIYSYDGLTLNMNFVKLFVSIIFLFVLSIFSPKDKNRPSSFLFIMMEFFIFIPLLSYYWLNNKETMYIFYVLICLIIIGLILRLKPKYIAIKGNAFSLFLIIAFVIYILMNVLLVIKRGGIDARAFNFDTIYALRSENNISGIAGYFVNWCAKSFFPFFLLYFYVRKKYILLFPISILQLLLYLSFGNKAFLFSLGVVIITIIFIEKNIYLKGLGIFLVFINIFSYVLKIFDITDSLYRAIPYRMLFIPAQIQFQYYAFFDVRDKMLYSEGLIGKLLLLNNPFSDPVPIIISRYYLGRDSFSNTGLFSDAYYNSGVFGMLIIAILLGLIFLFIDSTTFNVPLYVVVGSLSYIIFVLNDTGLQTTLLTGGLGLTIILLLLLNSSLKRYINFK